MAKIFVMDERETILWRPSKLGIVHHVWNYAVGSCIKPNCATNEIPANTNASTAINVVIPYLMFSIFRFLFFW